MSSDNKVDRDGLTHFWSKANAYIQETIEYAQQFWIKVGNSPMGTTAATITGAIKEIVDKIGNTAMGTTATTVTGAVKEHNDFIGDTSMGTTATTLTGAIAEHETDIANLNSKIRFGSLNTYNETPQNYQFVKNGNVATFSYQGENKARSENQLIFTIASGYRPINDFYVVGTLGASAPCIFKIETNGQCTIYTASSYPASRAYLSGSYIVADA